MILSRCCNAPLYSHDKRLLKTTGETCRRFRCTCCGKLYSAYSKDGESWKWEQRPPLRPVKRILDEMVFA